MKTTRSDRHLPSYSSLIKKGIPAVLIPGILASMVLGWNGKPLDDLHNWYQSRRVFPYQSIVSQVQDGDTFTLKNGQSVRLIGINAPDRGKQNYLAAANYLKTLILNQKVYLEYDRYQDDKYGRILSWVWVACEKNPSFKPSSYMHLTYNSSKEGLIDNPPGCLQGKLVNEEMVKNGLADPTKYKDRGELKYEKRLAYGQ